jgi:two-component system, chemotaxis family, protein-glutamate methylesterase/glutaminase
MIRVLVVDDSITVRQRLIEILRKDPEFEVVGEAGDGRGAIEQTARLRPDVLTLDIVMPDMTGLGATEHIMAHTPTPILIVSSSFNRGELFDTYAALAAGAVDVLDKSAAGDPEWEDQLISAVRMVSRIKVITHPRGRLGSFARITTPPAATVIPDPPPAAPRPAGARAIELLAIGASTGGPSAIAQVLGGIPAPCPLPILVVLHLDRQFGTAFAEWLDSRTPHAVRLATDGELLHDLAGQVRIAAPDHHLIVTGRRLALIRTPPRNHCRPAIDVLYESLATELPGRVGAAVLTGMGRDGAAGLLAIRRAGGATIAQDEATSVVYGMPRECVVLGAAERELPLAEIGPALAALRPRGRDGGTGGGP